MAKKPLDDATKKRLRAGRMLLAGKRPAEVALAVGVARQTVYTWKGLLDEGGINTLRAAPGRGRPASSMGSNWRNCDACYCGARPSMALVPNYGRSSASACSSSACMASSLAKRRFGACLGRWVSARKNPSGVRSSETRKLYATGSDTLGLRKKKSMVTPIFATLIFDVVVGLLKSIRRRCGDI